MKRGAVPDPFAAFPMRVGDVVVRDDGDERWLRSALVFQDDDRAALALLFMEEVVTARPDAAVLALAGPDRRIGWLDRADVPLPLTPPAQLEIAGELYARGPSFWGNERTVAVYRSAGERVAVAIFGAHALVLAGPSLGPDDYDVLGAATGESR